MKPITESTTISIGLIVVLFAGIFWLSSLYSVASSTEHRVSKVETKNDALIEDIHTIKEDLAVIKEILKKNR